MARRCRPHVVEHAGLGAVAALVRWLQSRRELVARRRRPQEEEDLEKEDEEEEEEEEKCSDRDLVAIWSGKTRSNRDLRN